MPSQSPSQSRFPVRLFAALAIASIGAASAVEVSALPAKPNVVVFLSDNGACAESPKVEYVDPDAPLGSVASYTSYGVNWATVSNTPLRMWKSTSHEGGVRTPLIAHWPAGIESRDDWVRDPVHLIDIMPTVLELAEASYPGSSGEPDTPSPDGVSLAPAFRGKSIQRDEPLFFQFNRGAAIRDGKWKLVRLGSDWELYDMSKDLTETNDLSERMSTRVRKLESKWEDWYRATTE